MDKCDVAIIGAGPYGLSVAAHLRQLNLDLRILGEPMSFWERQMPAGMLLRSPRQASHISDPHRRFTLDNYEKAAVKSPRANVPLQHFISYGKWFSCQSGLPIEARMVERVDAASRGFELRFVDGESLQAGRLIVAAGVAPFAHIPKPFADLPASLASHTSHHSDLGKFRGREIVVIGGGQSALESAVLLDRAGARVDVLVRGPVVHWLGIKRRWMHSKVVAPMFYGRADVGPAGVSLLVQRPNLFRRLPRSLQDWWGSRAIRPAASSWVKACAANVRIHTGCFVLQAHPQGERVRLRLSDGTERIFDHVLLGTGYQIDIARYPFLSPQLLEKIERVKGYPVLDAGFETSLPRLHFMGAAAAWSFGPLMRFVAGTEFASPVVARRIRVARERRTQAAVPAEISSRAGSWVASRSKVRPSS